MINENVFNDWTIDEEIGSGAFGTVYKIRREELGNTYYSALKVIKIPADSSELSSLRSEGMDDQSITAYYKDIVQSFVNEIKILNSLKGNSNIVSYEDHRIVANEDETEFKIYIRMELLTPLKDYIIANPLTERDVIRLGTDVCSALILCEKNNIIHRDIKPDNIFVSNNGDFKIGDFGVARTVEKTMAQMSKKGTYSYMAPEVYLGKPYDKRCDIYSLGIILYQFLNNHRVPFLPPAPQTIRFSDREKATNMRIAGNPVPPLNLANRALEDVVIRCCDANPNNRFSSASELRDALKKAETNNDGKVNNSGDNTDDKTVSQFVNPPIQQPPNFIPSYGGYPVYTPGTMQNVLPKNNLLESFKLFFKNYVNFNGRCRRSDYWNVILINAIIWIVLSALSSLIGEIAIYIAFAYSLVTVIPSISIVIRRLHDIDKSGALILVTLVPIVGTVLMLIWLTTDSTQGVNQYGNNQKYIEDII